MLFIRSHDAPPACRVTWPTPSSFTCCDTQKGVAQGLTANSVNAHQQFVSLWCVAVNEHAGVSPRQAHPRLRRTGRAWGGGAAAAAAASARCDLGVQRRGWRQARVQRSAGSGAHGRRPGRTRGPPRWSSKRLAACAPHGWRRRRCRCSACCGGCRPSFGPVGRLGRHAAAGRRGQRWRQRRGQAAPPLVLQVGGRHGRRSRQLRNHGLPRLQNTGGGRCETEETWGCEERAAGAGKARRAEQRRVLT